MCEHAHWIAILVWAYDLDGVRGAGAMALVQLVPTMLLASPVAALLPKVARTRALTIGYLAQAFTLTTGDLTASNAASGTVEAAAILIGPLACAALIGVVGPGGVVLFTGAVAAVGATLTATLDSRTAPGPSGVPIAVGMDLRAVLADQAARLLVGLTAAAYTLVGMIDILLVVLTIDLLGMGASGPGLLTAAIGLGALAGASLTFVLVGRERIASLLVAGGVVAGGFFALAGFAGSTGVAVALVAVSGAGRLFFDVTTRTFQQRLLPDRLLVALFGVQEAVIMAGMALGSLLARSDVPAARDRPRPVLVGGGRGGSCRRRGRCARAPALPLAGRDQRHGHCAQEQAGGLGAVDVLAQDRRGQEHRERGVQRGDDRGDAEVALASGEQEADGRRRSERTGQPTEREGGALRPPRLAQQCRHDHDHRGGDDLVEGEREQSRVLRELGQRHEEEAEAQAGECAVHRAARRRGREAGRLARDQPDCGDGEQDPEPDQQCGPLAERHPDNDGDDGRADAADGGHHAHPSGREAPVEERRPEAVADPGGSTPPCVGRRGVAVEDEPRGQHQQGTGQQGHQCHTPCTGALARQAAAEVREAVRQRREQAEDDGHQVVATPTSHTMAAIMPAASSMRMLTPTARSASLVEGHAAALPTRRSSAR